MTTDAVSNFTTNFCKTLASEIEKAEPAVAALFGREEKRLRNAVEEGIVVNFLYRLYYPKATAIFKFNQSQERMELSPATG